MGDTPNEKKTLPKSNQLPTEKKADVNEPPLRANQNPGWFVDVSQ